MKAAALLLGVNSYAAAAYYNYYYYEQLQKQLLQEGDTVFVYLHVVADMMRRLVALIRQGSAETLLKCAFIYYNRPTKKEGMNRALIFVCFGMRILCFD